MKHPTLATLKSFIRKNEGKLYIMSQSSFDGMTDSIERRINPTFTTLAKKEADPSRPFVGDSNNTLGFGIGSGVWLVGDSRDYIQPYNQSGYEGYEVQNSCGVFVVAIRQAATREAA